MVFEPESLPTIKDNSSDEILLAQQEAMEQLRRLIAELETRVQTLTFDRNEELLVRTTLISAKLLVALAAANECQIDVPYAPMRKIRKADGSTVWRCSHPTPHETM